MQPQRVQQQPVPPAPSAASEPEPSQAWVNRDGSPYAAGAEPPASPARMLRDELAMRLGELATPGVPAVVRPTEPKWPMAARIATILGVSVALWSGICFALVQLITR